MLQIAEIFESIQGESTWAGLPCGFVRLAGCNLRCLYCDSPHAWEGGRGMALSEVADSVLSFGHRLVEVTGGEPLLQEETPSLVAALLAEGRTVLVETNGSLDVSVLPDKAVRIMDIKTPGSGHGDDNAWGNLKHLKPWDEIKFVLTSKEDYEWAKSHLRRVAAAGVTKVFLSPAHGILSPALLARWMIADRLDARLQIQLHKHIGCK